MSFFQKHKQITVMLTLVSFMMLVFLGLTAMTHEQNGRMQGGCPFSAFGASLCPQDTFAVVFHKMFAYQSLFSIPTQFGAVISILSFFCVACGIHIGTGSPT